jgi:hypothetical protein
MNQPDKKQLTVLQQKINICYTKAKGLVVNDKKGLELAATWLGQVNAAIKAVKGDFDKAVKDAFAAHKSITALRKKHLDPLEAAKQIISGKLSSYHSEQKRVEREEEERRWQEAQEKKREEEKEVRRKEDEEREATANHLDDLGESEAAEAVREEDVPVTIAPLRVEPVKKEELPNGLHFRDNWKYRVNNLKEVPVEYLLPKQVDDTILKHVAKQSKGAAKIPGIEFYNEPIPIK